MRASRKLRQRRALAHARTIYVHASIDLPAVRKALGVAGRANPTVVVVA